MNICLKAANSMRAGHCLSCSVVPFAPEAMPGLGQVAHLCGLNTELTYFLLPSSTNRGHYGSNSYEDKDGKSVCEIL